MVISLVAAPLQFPFAHQEPGRTPVGRQCALPTSQVQTLRHRCDTSRATRRAWQSPVTVAWTQRAGEPGAMDYGPLRDRRVVFMSCRPRCVGTGLGEIADLWELY